MIYPTRYLNGDISAVVLMNDALASHVKEVLYDYKGIQPHKRSNKATEA